jgi:hypothetical protein
MSAPDRIATALGKLRQLISFDNAATSREERIAIMESAAAAMARTTTDISQHSPDYFYSLIGNCCVQFRRHDDNRVSCTFFPFQDEQAAYGVGATMGDAFEEAIKDALETYLYVKCIQPKKVDE